MPDYNDHNLTPLDPFHHVEGLVSLSDRVARRKKEQQRRRQQKDRQNEGEQAETDQAADPDASPTEPKLSEDEHIDFRA